MQVLQLNIRKALIDTMLSGIKQGGYHYNGKTIESDSLTSQWTVSFPVAFINACFMVTGSPVKNQNNNYAYRTGHHILWTNKSQFCYTVASEQQGSGFYWISVGH